jgi:hypothetical protein
MIENINKLFNDDIWIKEKQEYEGMERNYFFNFITRMQKEFKNIRDYEIFVKNEFANFPRYNLLEVK